MQVHLQYSIGYILKLLVGIFFMNMTNRLYHYTYLTVTDFVYTGLVEILRSKYCDDRMFTNNVIFSLIDDLDLMKKW